MKGLRVAMLGLSRRTKRAIQILADIILIWAALYLAFVVRLGFDDARNPLSLHPWLFSFAPLVSIPIFIRIGMYRAVMRYFGNDALVAIAKAVTLSSLVLALIVYWYSDHKVLVPRSIIFNYWWLSLVMIGGLRLAMRQFFHGDWFMGMQGAPLMRRDEGLTRVAVYGAGVAGNQLVAALRLGQRMRPVAFVDDDSSIANRVISGLAVYKPKHLEQMIRETGATEILLALPSVSRSRRKEILELLEGFPLHVRSVPNFSDLAAGRVSVQDLQEVDIADLLGRDTVPAQPELLSRCIQECSVLVTGAGGSIGSELCRQILVLRPRLLILFEHSEYNLYAIHQELIALVERIGASVQVLPILGSVRNPEKLFDVMRTWNIDTVYHAAAYKHVPIVEHNVAEGILNNVMGTLYTAQAAIRSHVANFVLVSTDKAVRPTNVMGSTKRLSEMLLQALSREVAPVLFQDSARVSQVNRTRFTMVRFGNVLGSSGSVIPLFHKQIRSGGPLTVTHPNVTRYFMTIPEAAQLVLQAGSMGKGGEVFVLDMGEPVRIVDLAEKMVRLSGLSVRSEKNPQGDLSIEFTGLRPGEKLYEELLIGDNIAATSHPMILSAQEDALGWEELKRGLQTLLDALHADDYLRVRYVLRELVSGYAPTADIVDWKHLQQRRDL
jgi:FlaA1/EpsC-like NDP-sugar epimerase